MPIFNVRIDKSLGGKTGRYNWSDSYRFVSQADIAAPLLKDFMTALADIEAVAHCDSVYINGAYLVQVADNPLNKPPKRHVTMEFDKKGLRASAYPMLPLEVVLRIKKDVTEGNSGFLNYRGCLFGDDVVSAPDGTFQLVNAAAFTTGGIGNDTLVEKLNAGLPGGNFVMKDPPGMVVQYSREITGHKLAGITNVQTTRSVVSVASLEARLAQRKINELNTSLLDVIGDIAINLLSGNLLGEARSIANAALAILNALGFKDRNKVKLTPALRAIAALPG